MRPPAWQPVSLVGYQPVLRLPAKLSLQTQAHGQKAESRQKKFPFFFFEYTLEVTPNVSTKADHVVFSSNKFF